MKESSAEQVQGTSTPALRGRRVALSREAHAERPSGRHNHTERHSTEDGDWMFRAGGRRGGETRSWRWLRAQRHSRRPSLRLANRRPEETEPQTGNTARAAAPVERGQGSCILSKAVLDHFHRISWFKIINLKIFLKCQRNIQGHWKFRSEEFTVETPPACPERDAQLPPGSTPPPSQSGWR